MWDDVVIGEGNRGNVATTLWKSSTSDHDVSSNSAAYWISGCILGCGMTILKNTTEAAELRHLIGDNNEQEITDWLDKVLLREIAVPLLSEKINSRISDAFLAGKRAKVAEIKKALSI